MLHYLGSFSFTFCFDSHSSPSGFWFWFSLISFCFIFSFYFLFFGHYSSVYFFFSFGFFGFIFSVFYPTSGLFSCILKTQIAHLLNLLDSCNWIFHFIVTLRHQEFILHFPMIHGKNPFSMDLDSTVRSVILVKN